ncbi:MAG: hypothetical protein ABEK59_08150 [Halobacteria archaeon]
MKPRKFLWWGDEIKNFDRMAEERGWVSRDGIEDFILEKLPTNPTKVRMEVPTDYWADIEHPDLDGAGEVDLLELEGLAHFEEMKIDFRMVARMVRDPENPGIDWKVLKMQKKHS